MTTHDALYLATSRQYRRRETVDVEVWGELPSGLVMHVRFEAINADDEETCMSLARRALLDVHCDNIESEVN